MEETLTLLADAIADVGVWTWWQGETAEYIQVEFCHTQLWNAPVTDSEPPSGQIAIRFDNPASVAFLTFEVEVVPEDWPQLLHQDEIDCFALDSEAFTFTDTQLIVELLAQCAAVETWQGSPPHEVDWAISPVKLGFRVGLVGLLIAAEQMKLLTLHGEFGLDEVEAKHQQWWDYWKEYWRLIDTDNPLPEDYACEVTIPAG